MKALITDAEKLAAVEATIEDLRWARNEPDIPEHRRLAVLKALAMDLRAAEPGAGSRTLRAIESHIDAAARQKERSGLIGMDHCREVAQAVLKHWPTIRLALTKNEETAS